MTHDPLCCYWSTVDYCQSLSDVNGAKHTKVKNVRCFVGLMSNFKDNYFNKKLTLDKILLKFSLKFDRLNHRLKGHASIGSQVT